MDLFRWRKFDIFIYVAVHVCNTIEFNKDYEL